MPRGTPPIAYYHNPSVDKPIYQIYREIDEFNHEYHEDESHFYNSVSICVLLPPVVYEGKFLKGILFSQGIDWLLSRHPQLPQLFHTMAFSMWSSYPQSKHADAYFTCYKNKKRDDWLRKSYPDRGNRILIPLLDSDYVNEYWFVPQPGQQRDIDILSVSRLHEHKNLHIIAEALKICRDRHSARRIRMTLIVGKDFDMNWNGLTDAEKEELTKMQNILGHLRDYIDIVPRANYFPDLPQYYSRSKVCVLGSLIEGKNRSLLEAMSCDTPVVCFEEYNQYVRGDEPVFPEGAGLYAKYNAESLAEKLVEAIDNFGDFKPRLQYLKYYGRRNFFNTCLDALPYYRQNVPDYVPGQGHLNKWLDLAVQENYQLSLHDFLYDRNRAISTRLGFPEIDSLLDFYYQYFNIKQSG